MDDLNTVQTAANRKTVCDNAVANQSQQSFRDAQLAAQQTKIQSHFCRRIYEWCNETNINSPTSTEGTLIVPINNLVTGNVLNEWQTALEGRGYVITRSGYEFKIALA